MIIAIVLVGIVLLLCIVEWIREIKTFQIKHYDIVSDKLTGIEKEQKILFLTDLHNNSYGKNNVKLLERIRKESPDYIFVGGDMLVGKKGVSTNIAEDFVRQLTELCPVYYGNGNHEFRMKIDTEEYGDAFQPYKKALVDSGVCFLENEHVDLMWGNVPVQIHGLEIPREAYKKFKKTEVSLEEVEERIGKADERSYKILLAHNPSYVDVYRKWGADLILCGHLHGGVVRIPKLGGVITPQFFPFPKYSGELTVEDDVAIVVSKGLGTHTIKVRFLNPAEVVVLHLKGKEK